MKITTATTTHWVLCALFFVGMMIPPSESHAAIGTTFTYQGRVAQSGTTVTGTLDFEFELYDSLSGGTSVGGPLTLAGVTCTDGLFTVPLDFGAAAFAGDQRWLEIRVSQAFPGTPYTVLTPRQELTPDPYAIFATGATNAVNADNATNATNAVNAQNAVNATNADNATTADSATNATNAANAANADLLDGIDSTGFSLVAHTHAASTISGVAATAVVFGTGTGLAGDVGNFTYDPVLHDLNLTGVYRIGSNSVLRVAPALDNTFVGLSGNGTVTGNANTSVGEGALIGATSNSQNTAVGFNALRATVAGNPTEGNFNTAIGSGTMSANTLGFANVAIGTGALAANLTGFINTAVGAGALAASTAVNGNVAIGASALAKNTSGGNNTAVGTSALTENLGGGRNSALGQAALNANTTGNDNTAMGALAMQKNLGGAQNTAIGASAMLENTTGGSNTAVGAYALDSNVGGGNNTAIGSIALTAAVGAINNTALGASALSAVNSGNNNVGVGLNAGIAITTGSNNIVIGGGSGTNPMLSNNIIIGHPGVPGDDSKIRLGTNGVHVDTRIGGINGIAIPGPGIPVIINANGQLGTVIASSGRFKEAVRDMGVDADKLLALRPVIFRYRAGVAADGDPRADQYGLIAEEVAAINPDWVVRDRNGVIVSVRYDQVNAALLGLAQRQQAQIDLLSQQMRDLAKRMDRLQTTEAN